MKTTLKMILPAAGVAALLASPVMAQSITAIRQNTAAPAGVVQDLGNGLLLLTSCHDGGMVKVTFDNNGPDDATLNWLYSDKNGRVQANGAVVQRTSAPTRHPPPELGFINNRIEGQFIFANGAGDTTVNLHAFDGTTFCEVQGTAVFAPPGP
jgi:hypothetical protein